MSRSLGITAKRHWHWALSRRAVSLASCSLAAVVQLSLVAYYRLNDTALRCRFGWAIHVWIARLVDS
eukprot:1412264-Rhodomonas_salina.2